MANNKLLRLEHFAQVLDYSNISLVVLDNSGSETKLSNFYGTFSDEERKELFAELHEVISSYTHKTIENIKNPHNEKGN